jgi:putative FmdB family regulatory protein
MEGQKMALIDFKCSECGEKFDEIVKQSNRESIRCPKCGSKEVKQLFEGRCNAGGSGKGGGSCSSGSCGGCSGCH